MRSSSALLFDPVMPLYYKADTYLLKDYVSGVYTDSSAHIYFKNAVVTK